MSDFISRLIGDDEPEKHGKRHKTCHSMTMTGDQLPDLADALNVLLFYAMNSPRGPGHGIREVGEKVMILMPDVEVAMIDKRTGQSETGTVGTFKITIEKVDS